MNECEHPTWAVWRLQYTDEQEEVVRQQVYCAKCDHIIDELVPADKQCTKEGVTERK